MKLLCKEVTTKAEAEKFVIRCEKEFKEKLIETVSDVLARGNRIITLSGPTCSGKTTTAKILVDQIERSGRHAVVISIDDFYLDNLRQGIGKNKKIDFDSVKTIDLEYLGAFTKSLLAYERVKIPIFDFTTGLRGGYREYKPKIEDVFVFEGIQAVYPEVTALFGNEFTSIFICVTDEVVCNGITFSPHEIRLLRRIVRDKLFRNTSPENTLMFWDSVRENEDVSIFPNAANQNFYIDSFLPYELFVIAELALPLLNEIDADSPYKTEASSLAFRLQNVKNSFYDTSLVPKGSMFREFIG